VADESRSPQRGRRGILLRRKRDEACNAGEEKQAFPPKGKVHASSAQGRKEDKPAETIKAFTIEGRGEKKERDPANKKKECSYQSPSHEKDRGGKCTLIMSLLVTKNCSSRPLIKEEKGAHTTAL